MLYLSRITDATVDAFATWGFNVRMRKYASCGPRLTARSGAKLSSHHPWQCVKS